MNSVVKNSPMYEIQLTENEKKLQTYCATSARSDVNEMGILTNSKEHLQNFLKSTT